MTPDDERHGTYAGAVAHAKEGSALCEPCLVARRRYAKRVGTAHRMGRKLRMDAAVAQAHIARLRAGGMLPCEIARQAGVSIGTVHRLSEPAATRVTRKVALALLSVPLPTPGEYVPAFTPSRGTVRRVRALVAIGYSFTDLADMLPVTHRHLTRIAVGELDMVRGTTREAVSRLYDRLALRPRVGADATHARRFAARRGWASPLAWDDIDRDARPVGMRRQREAG